MRTPRRPAVLGLVELENPTPFAEKISVAFQPVLADANCTKVRLSAVKMTYIYGAFNATAKTAVPSTSFERQEKIYWKPDASHPRAGKA